jgi:hypothetical protein
MNKVLSSLLILFLIPILLSGGCGKGISPEPESAAGFGGKITFTGTWPDSIARTHIVLFKDPLLAAGDFNILNLKFVSREIPYESSEFNYSSLDSAIVPQQGSLSAGEYSYLAVAMSKTPELSLDRIDWFVAGIYFLNGDTTKPGLLRIPEKTFVKNINIICDFNNPPVQPPGGR